jgi:hypothetical protein
MSWAQVAVVSIAAISGSLIIERAILKTGDAILNAISRSDDERERMSDKLNEFLRQQRG